MKNVIKFLHEWKWALILLAVCIAGIPLSTFLGIKSVTWGNDFWPNALSEMMGMFIDLIFGALFTFVVIDKYISYHKNKQWKKIKNITYKNLYFLLSGILLKLNESLPKEMHVKQYVLAEDFATLNDYLPKADFDIVVETLNHNIYNIINQEHPVEVLQSFEKAYFEDNQIHSSLVKFKQSTARLILDLNNLVVTKLLNFSDDTDFLDNIIEFEELFHSLMEKICVGNKKNCDANNEVKYIWLLKIQEILNRIKSIADSIEDDIDLD